MRVSRTPSSPCVHGVGKLFRMGSASSAGTEPSRGPERVAGPLAAWPPYCDVPVMNKTILPGLAAAALTSLLLGCASAERAPSRPAADAQVSEALKAISIESKLIDKLGADALGITARVAGHTATLTGTVERKSSQKLAESVALSVEGIRKVENEVVEETKPAPLANAKSNVKDAVLLSRVKTVLLTDIGVNALKIDVDVTDGVVSLRGKLGNPDINKEAITKTRSIKGVRNVIDLLG